MNKVYVYDGTFLGLLTLIKYLLSNKIKPYNIVTSDYQGNLFLEVINLHLKVSDKISGLFYNVFDKVTMKRIYYVFLSKEKNKEIIIYYYLLNYLKYGYSLSGMRNLKCVSKVLEINKKVGNEAHKLKGFVRFKELKQNILYAEINPDNDVLEIISRHFKKRLKNEYWVIKDVSRNIVSIYDKKDFHLALGEDVKIIQDLSAREEEFSKMWQDFYKIVAIKERKNEKCRRNFMPKKYWPYLLEVRDEL